MLKIAITTFILALAACGTQDAQLDGQPSSPEPVPVTPGHELMIVNDDPDADPMDCDLGTYAVTVGGGRSVSMPASPRTVTCTWFDGRSFTLVLQ